MSIPFGAAPLIKLREQGRKPVGSVWVNYGDDYVELEWWRFVETQAQATITVRTTDPIDRLDLRCLVGLNVTLHFAQWDSRVARLLERLKEYSAEIAVLSPAFEDDLGFWWIRGRGQFALFEYPHSENRSVA